MGARESGTERTEVIVAVLQDAFADLMEADPVAFRTKYRKMASDPHAFYRGTACLFYNDVTAQDQEWADRGAERIWIHGDLHVENFGTYLNSGGRLVFDVNDFDEAYLGSFAWDLQRFAASLALVGWQKALPGDAVASLVETYVRAYLEQVDHYVASDDDDFAIRLDNADGAVLVALRAARGMRRSDLLDSMTRIESDRRRFVEGPTTRRLEGAEEDEVVAAFERYLDTIPPTKRFDRELFYELRDVVGTSGFGIGSAGLPAYNFLVEGHSQALENDVVLGMKQANVPAVSRFVDSAAVERYFEHEGHRTAVSQRALQVHTDPLLGHTTLGGRGYVVAEVSPYEVDLDWGEINEPDQMHGLVEMLGRATAKIHCSADEDSDQSLVEFQVEDAVVASLEGRREDFVDWLCGWGADYAVAVRADHALFVEAFREGRVGIDATGSAGGR